MARLVLIPREKWPGLAPFCGDTELEGHPAAAPEVILERHLEFVDTLLDIARGDAWINRAETDGGVVPVVVWGDGQPETHRVCLADGERIAMPRAREDAESEHIVVRVDTRRREDAEVHVRTLAALQPHVEGLLRLEAAAARCWDWDIDKINQRLEYERSSGRESAFLLSLRDGFLSRPARTALEWYRTAYADRLGECHSAAYLNTVDEDGRVSERQPHIDAALGELVRFGESLEQRGAERAELFVECRHLDHALNTVVKTLRGLIGPAVRAVLEHLPMRAYAADYTRTYAELLSEHPSAELLSEHPSAPGLRVAFTGGGALGASLPSVSPGLARGLRQRLGPCSAYKHWLGEITGIRSAARAFVLSCTRLHREAPFLVRVRLAVAEGGLRVALSVEESTLASGLSHPAATVLWERIFGAQAWALLGSVHIFQDTVKNELI
jgi:hypothetical protein